MPSWNFVPWSLTYLVSALISIAISIDILRRSHGSSLNKQFFVYGLVTTCYLILVALALSAPTMYLALDLGRLSDSLYIISIAMLTYFVYNLSGSPGKAWPLLFPPMLAVFASAMEPFDIEQTDFGWKFRGVPTIQGAAVFIYIISYSIITAINLYHLTREARAPWLKGKYWLMLLGFVIFQIVGVILTNALVLVWTNIPHVAGLLYCMSMISIWYGFTIGAPKEAGLTQTGFPLSDSYHKFINKFLEVAPSDELGLKTMNLLEYLDKTRLSDVVTYDRLRIVLNTEKIEKIDNIQALDKTIEYLKDKDWTDKLADSFLGILESVWTNIESSPTKRETFQTVLLIHQDFLKKIDVIYGLCGGKFLMFTGEDFSLQGLPEWESTLRIYRRLLLPVRGLFMGPFSAEFFKYLRSIDIVKNLDISEDGEIDIQRILSQLGTMPLERRADLIRTAFNGLISWIIKTLMANNPVNFSMYLMTIKRTIRLNSSVPGVWRIYVSLVDRLSKDIGRSSISELILLEGQRAQNLDAFASTLAVSHDRLLHDKILVEYDPRFPYENYVKRIIDEISSNSERCVVFTRAGSKILSMSKETENIESRILATPGIQEEGSVPFNDVTRLLQAIVSAMESEFETWVLFDNISDLIIASGSDQSYIFARRAIDIITSKNGSLIILMNRGAHPQETKYAFEGLFSSIVEIIDKPKFVKG